MSTAPTPDSPPVSLDLDALDRENDPGLFVLAVSGRRYELCDPKALPWQELIAADVDGDARVGSLVKMAPAGDRDALRDALKKLPTWKLEKVADAYNTHFAFPSTPEGSGSPTS